jgi:hypothetical protein
MRHGQKTLWLLLLSSACGSGGSTAEAIGGEAGIAGAADARGSGGATGGAPTSGGADRSSEQGEAGLAGDLDPSGSGGVPGGSQTSAGAGIGSEQAEGGHGQAAMAGSSGAGADGSGGVGQAGSGPGLSADYPGDVGIADDARVLWVEDFEEGSVEAVTARYEDFKNAGGMTLVSDVPSRSSGTQSLRLVASGSGTNATDLFKRLPDSDELYVRYYAKYEAGVAWHHTGVWIGGYHPGTDWPNPQAGLLPQGDDRFSVALEPTEQGATPRMDFYNYWMKMHSWMDEPSGNTAYYGNSLVHDPSLTAREAWQCFEVHVKLNPDPSSGAAAELGLWVEDEPVIQFTDTEPLGYWVKDKFCPEAATGSECTDYRPAQPDLVPLDLRYRSTLDLKLNHFWPQNYITEGGAGSVWYDDMVVAGARIGCIR